VHDIEAQGARRRRSIRQNQDEDFAGDRRMTAWTRLDETKTPFYMTFLQNGPS
jgi:hypothetical protein